MTRMMPMTVSDHVTVNGMEYELVCRAKCAGSKGWMANPCKNGVPDRNKERWIGDDEITGVLNKKTRQFRMDLI